MLCYVDDLLLLAKLESSIDSIRRKLNDSFLVNSLGKANKLFEFDTTWKSNGSLGKKQSQFTNKLFQHRGIWKSRLVDSPIDQPSSVHTSNTKSVDNDQH